MTATVLDGRDLAAVIRAETAAQVVELTEGGTRPTLAVVMAGTVGGG